MDSTLPVDLTLNKPLTCLTVPPLSCMSDHGMSSFLLNPVTVLRLICTLNENLENERR